jgi:hypothetical protein
MELKYTRVSGLSFTKVVASERKRKNERSGMKIFLAIFA